MLSAKAPVNIWPEPGYNCSLLRELGHVPSAGLVFFATCGNLYISISSVGNGWTIWLCRKSEQLSRKTTMELTKSVSFVIILVCFITYALGSLKNVIMIITLLVSCFLLMNRKIRNSTLQTSNKATTKKQLTLVCIGHCSQQMWILL